MSHGHILGPRLGRASREHNLSDALATLYQLVRLADPFHLEHGALSHLEFPTLDPLHYLAQVRTYQLVLLS